MGRQKKYYPAFMDIEGRKCVVVGGGKVALRKVRDLLGAGADVRVISPELTPDLLKLKGQDRIKHSARQFRPSDLKGAALVVAATSDMEANRKVAAHAGAVPVNVVDMPELCGFIVPASVKRGPLTIAVSTSGASPAMARAIKDSLAEQFGPEVGRYLQKLGAQRRRIIKETTDPAERERKLKGLGSPETLASLTGCRPAAKKKPKSPKRSRR